MSGHVSLVLQVGFSLRFFLSFAWCDRIFHVSACVLRHLMSHLTARSFSVEVGNHPVRPLCCRQPVQRQGAPKQAPYAVDRRFSLSGLSGNTLSDTTSSLPQRAKKTACAAPLQVEDLVVLVQSISRLRSVFSAVSVSLHLGEWPRIRVFD